MIAIAAAAVLVAGLTATSSLSASASSVPLLDDTPVYADGGYVVVLAGEPAAAYTGGVAGLRATAPRAAATFDSTTAAAQAYTDHLRERQNRIADAVGAEPFYHYTDALNGFAADLSGEQAAELAHRPGVLAVAKDEIRKPDTWHTPEMLKLTGDAGVWRRLGGSSPKDGAGKGTVIGIVDSGVNSDSASFAATGGPIPDSWNGECQQSDDDDPAADFVCNDKLIGGEYFDEGYGDVYDGEFLSPEDFGGHGSHTASTAAGNSGVEASAGGIDFGQISGMAPAAKVASYKVCWEEEEVDAGGCASSDSVAAIDAAVGDGVDAINFSISGSIDDPVDPVEIAFMYAADAGVFVSTSAGNDGPGVSTVAHPSPWLTTTANSTHYLYEGTLEFGNGDKYIGASVSTQDVPSAPIVTSVNAKADGATEADAALCLPDTLDPAAAEGTIVICDRGQNDRVEKSQVVADAGGVGAVIVNVPGGADDTVADLHTIPTIHLRAEFRDDLYADATEADATAQILARVNDGTTTTPPPSINSGSSRGPSLAADGDLLKPDITAPGTDVLAAVAPERNNDEDFALYTGTSMASPHIAGLGLLFKQKYPDWSPMEIKSAMMTTAADLNGDKSPFSQGAGFVTPRRFFDPGLVFDSDFDDWTSYLAGQGVTYTDGTPISDTPRKASNTNTPSIAINDLAGRETVTRTVTNVDNTSSTYTIRAKGLDGVEMTAAPASFTIAPGATQRVRLRFERTTAPIGEYATGNVLLADGAHRVRVPTVIKPTALEAPVGVQVGAAKKVTTKSGINGNVQPEAHGLVPAVDTAAEAENTNGAVFDPADERNYAQTVKAGENTNVLQLEVMPEFAADDLDLYVFDPSGALAGQSATGGSNESVTIADPEPGKYSVFVQAWAVHDNAATTSFEMRSYKVGAKDTGTLSVSPGKQQVEPAGENTWRLATSGLDAGTPYLGVIDWTRNGGKVLARTMVRAQR